MSDPSAGKVGPGGVKPSSLRAWVLAARPATLTVAMVPVVVGSAVAQRLGGLRLGPALAALLGAIWIQIGTNLANDVFDFEKGADTGARLGPLRVTQAGLLTPKQVRRGMVVSFALATLCGIYLTLVAGPIVVAIGLLSIASGIAYTGGPYPLGYHGLGDLFVFLFFGLVAVCGTVFVEVGRLSGLAVAAALPVGAIATAVLVVNNVRDFPTDSQVGKRTLVVRFGRGFGVGEYLLLLALAYLVPVGLLLGGVGSGWLLLPLGTLPLALPLGRAVVGSRDAALLNRTLAGTARLLLLFGLLFAVGIVVS
jgi:1,4-dihydroxy-2-naphthoate octaprenyltransferase